MTEQTYEEATKLHESIRLLEEVNINMNDEDESIYIPCLSLDATTNKEIKEALTSVVRKRLSEIRAEFDQL